jgi:hypothetical protein
LSNEKVYLPVFPFSVLSYLLHSIQRSPNHFSSKNIYKYQMHVSFIPLSLLAARALADGAAIVAAMTTISEATVALDSTVTSFPSNPLLDLLDVGPLLTDCKPLSHKPSYLPYI